MTAIDQAEVDSLLAVSDERDQQLELRLAAWRAGWAACWMVAFEAGRCQADTEHAQDWKAAAGALLAVADPRGPEARASVDRRVRAAEAVSRRVAADHWRSRWRELFALSRDEKFIREALTTKPWKRDYEQTMALRIRAERMTAA